MQAINVQMQRLTVNASTWPGQTAFINLMTRGAYAEMDTITFDGAPHDEIQGVMSWIEQQQSQKSTLLFYDSHTRETIFRVPSSMPQQVTVGRFSQYIRGFSSNTGIDPFIRGCGSTTVKSKDDRFHAEPDASWQPVSRIRRKDPCPTIMVVVGETQSHSSLRRVMQGWFKMSEGQVRIVIIIDIRRQESGKHEFVFEKWRYGEDGEPLCDTEISVTLRPDFDSPNLPRHDDFIITTKPQSRPLPMVLEFGLVYDRVPGPREEDILIPALTFQDIASYVWVCLL
ncbi:hypothetical protein F5X68DRAFT_234094 [Plectosphaerella plurivora]|uniref:Uncharacterized protein n=1 Tax=Plectosphaerella plurivora TaxID=936078 RepID=A0A9P8V612_9PEZI|nr:hypothetical protein F5X68DRAFT_234094 [Plectosphaerella plurivora]